METESVCPSAVMLPPKNCIPRNYSCIAGLFGGLATTQTGDDGDGEKADGDEDGVEEMEKIVNGECAPLEIRVVDERPRGRESFLKPPPQSPTQRRRCKSLPSPAERARLEIARSRSPNSQKKVRFADSLGLELISVKHFDDADEPEIPERVMDKFRKARALHLNSVEAASSSTQSVFMELLFTNPCTSPNFMKRVKELHVSLERVDADEFCLSGLVRVLNVAFEKSVLLRYTLNSWATFVDAPASYVPHSSDGFTDKFSFKIVTPTFLAAGGTLQFAIKYVVDDHEYWDNNGGDNYKVRRHKFKISPPREWENGWIHFI
ncbi:protein phosphatase 1 regulatory subunit 3E [Hoplias malabaricus]|uniref:protein phosphatase 1 regulatory subunit 3E n=1 Tax=Hoplias malabaricus TaxID=27720 RepID=UPI003462D169